jgi:hypothetical protein
VAQQVSRTQSRSVEAARGATQGPASRPRPFALGTDVVLWLQRSVGNQVFLSVQRELDRDEQTILWNDVVAIANRINMRATQAERAFKILLESYATYAAARSHVEDALTQAFEEHVAAQEAKQLEAEVKGKLEQAGLSSPETVTLTTTFLAGGGDGNLVDWAVTFSGSNQAKFRATMQVIARIKRTHEVVLQWVPGVVQKRRAGASAITILEKLAAALGNGVSTSDANRILEATAKDSDNTVADLLMCMATPGVAASAYFDALKYLSGTQCLPVFQKILASRNVPLALQMVTFLGFMPANSLPAVDLVDLCPGASLDGIKWGYDRIINRKADLATAALQVQFAATARNPVELQIMLWLLERRPLDANSRALVDFVLLGAAEADRHKRQIALEAHQWRIVDANASLGVNMRLPDVQFMMSKTNGWRNHVASNARDAQYWANNRPNVQFNSVIEGGDGTMERELLGVVNQFMPAIVALPNGHESPLFQYPVSSTAGHLWFSPPGSGLAARRLPWKTLDVVIVKEAHGLILKHCQPNTDWSTS